MKNCSDCKYARNKGRASKRLYCCRVPEGTPLVDAYTFRQAGNVLMTPYGLPCGHEGRFWEKRESDMVKRINSRQKGAQGERELSQLLTEKGFAAKRGQQHAGSPDSPDVVCPAIDKLGYHIECKRVEKLDLYGALAQAQRDAGPMKTGVVLHRRNKQGWVAIMPLDEFCEFMRLKGEE